MALIAALGSLAALITSTAARRQAHDAAEQTALMRHAHEKRIEAEKSARVGVQSDYDGRTQRIVIFNNGQAEAVGISFDSDQGTDLGIYDGIQNFPLSLEPGGEAVIKRAVSSATPLTVRVRVWWSDGTGNHERGPELLQL